MSSKGETPEGLLTRLIFQGPLTNPVPTGPLGPIGPAIYPRRCMKTAARGKAPARGIGRNFSKILPGNQAHPDFEPLGGSVRPGPRGSLPHLCPAASQHPGRLTPRAKLFGKTAT